MKIQVIGTGCPKCTKLYESTKKAIESMGIEAEIEKVEDLMEIVRLGVMTSPSIMLDGKLVISGQVVPEAKIIEIIQKHNG